MFLVAAVIVVFAQVAVGYLVLKDLFSFVNLIDVRTPEEFDSPHWVIGSSAVLDLDLPNTDSAFEARVQEALGHASSSEEKFETAVKWVHSQLQPGGVGTETVFVPRGRWAAGEIFAGSQRGAKYLCDTYARFTASVGQALGVDTRVIWLEGHVVVEGFDSRRRRWMAADPTFSAVLVRADDASTLSYAEARTLVRSGEPISVRILGQTRPEVDVEASLKYLLKMLRRDQLVYVDGRTTVMGNNLQSMRDWLLGRSRGVRMVSEDSSGRVWKRRVLVANTLVLVALLVGFGWSHRNRVPA